uniref:B2 mating type protein n=1 Tax=Heterobasidion irregulare TaxID=984962 RepID=S5RTL5_9AGAM|nr:b2 mating type protein [Heterobasidion irregulare]
MSYSDHLRAIAHTAEGSTWYQASSKAVSRFSSTAAGVQYTSILPNPEVVSYTFTLPNPLTADLVALGLSEATSEKLSSNYLRASIELKAAYEAEFRRSTTVCLQVIRMFRLVLPGFEKRMHSTYASRYTNAVNSWAEKQMSVTRQKLMHVTLSARYCATPLLQSSTPKPGKIVFVTEKNSLSSQVGAIPSKSRFRRVKIENMESHDLSSNSDKKGSINNVIDLTSSFLPQPFIVKFEDDTLSHHEAPSHAFPTVYHSRSLPSRGDSCLKILPRGLRRTISSQTTDVDSLIHAFGRFFPEALPDCKNSYGKNGSYDPEEGTAGYHFSARSPPSSLSSDLPVSSPSTVLKPPVFSPPTKLRDSRGSFERPSISLSPQHPGFKAHRQCKVSTIPTLHLATSTDARLPQLPVSVSAVSSPRVEKPGSPILATTVPHTASTSLSPRRRKVARLPTRRAPALPILAPTMPDASPLPPLNVANVSSLPRSSFPSTRSRSTISRTPSLVSLASSDSESSTPSSDGLDTPPSTPPPFITKFPWSMSPSSLSSKPFTPTFDSTLSPGNLLQFSSARQPKIFEAHLPSSAPPFGFSAGIKREEVSFSFAFNR